MTRHELIADTAGSRLDVFVSVSRPELSRSRVKDLIDQGLVFVDGRPLKASARLKPGQTVSVTVPDPVPLDLAPEPLNLTVVFQDESLIVIDKPPGLVVHPAPGHGRGTLVHGLLHLCPDLSGVGGVRRPGIVHRLDKDTSGLLVAAKTEAAHQALVAAFKSRRVAKTYLALLWGNPAWSIREVDAGVGRHPVQRKKMAVIPSGRPARSVFRVKARLGAGYFLAEVDLLTGRTHQIRLHAAHIGHPVLGDALYGRRGPLRGQKIPRQMLHAWRLEFDHPVTGQRLKFQAPPPADMAALIGPEEEF